MHTRKVPFVGMMGWAVNSIAKAVEGSIPFLPIGADPHITVDTIKSATLRLQ